MKKTKRGKKARRVVASGSVARTPVPLTSRERFGVRAAACISFALGGMLLVKVAFTLLEGTAWDDLSTSSRQSQPFEYWSFVVTYLLMAAFLIWLGVELWEPGARRRSRAEKRVPLNGPPD
ncbi:MAG TPA: hypothetical protein VK358_00785 [Longimicrobium sp.]|nr:hypothetical protein [Longimicrobium sp.]